MRHTITITITDETPYEIEPKELDTWLKTTEQKRRKKQDEQFECLHKNCAQCGGTGNRKDGLGNCVHMLSCPCFRCRAWGAATYAQTKVIPAPRELRDKMERLSKQAPLSFKQARIQTQAAWRASLE